MSNIKSTEKSTPAAKGLDEAQDEFLKGLDVSGLREVADLFGIKDLPEGASRNVIIDRIKKRNTVKVQYAKTVELPDGEQVECPVGYAIVRISLKNSQEFSTKSRETFFLNCQGHNVVGRRGVPVCLHEKFLGVLKDAVEQHGRWIESSDWNKNKLETYLVYSEDYTVLYHNPDTEAAKRAEEELVANARADADDRRLKREARNAMLGILNNR